MDGAAAGDKRPRDNENDSEEEGLQIRRRTNWYDSDSDNGQNSAHDRSRVRAAGGVGSESEGEDMEHDAPAAAANDNDDSGDEGPDVIETTMPFDWMLSSDTVRARIARGFFMPPDNFKRMLYDESGMLHAHVFYEKMHGYAFPKQLTFVMEAIGEVDNALRTTNIDIATWMAEKVGSSEVSACGIGATQPVVQIDGRNIPFIRAFAQLVTIERTEPPPAGSDEQQSVTFCMMTVVTPAAFHLRKAIFDAMTENTATRGKAKNRKIEEIIKKRGQLIFNTEDMRSQMVQWQGMEDSQSYSGNDYSTGNFISPRMLGWLSLPSAMRQMHRMAAAELKTRVSRVRVAGWHKDVDWFGTHAERVMEQSAERGEWMEQCRTRYENWTKLSKRERKEDENQLVFPHPPAVDYQFVYEGDDGDAGLLSIPRTDSTFVIDVAAIGALCIATHELYWTFPDAVVQIMRGGSSALAEVDPEIWTKIKSEDVVVDRAAAQRIISGRMSKEEVHALCKSHRPRYDVMEKFVQELPIESRMRTWRCMVDANVESIAGDVHDHRWYESAEVSAVIPLLHIVNQILKNMIT